MGQIDLFEPDYKDKVLSEIVEIPDDKSVSEILEIADLTDGDLKADNDSDISELECKVDKVRLECDQKYEAQSSETDLAVVTHDAQVNMFEVPTDQNSVITHKSLDDDSFAQHSVVAPDQGCSLTQSALALNVEVNKSQIISNMESKPNIDQHPNSKKQAQMSDVIVSVHSKCTHPSHSNANLVQETSSDAKTHDDNTGNSLAKHLTLKSDSSSDQTVREPSPDKRCLSPNVDISIPPRPKSNSLASRRSKEITTVSVVSEELEIPKQTESTDVNNIPTKTQSEQPTKVQTVSGPANLNNVPHLAGLSKSSNLQTLNETVPKDSGSKHKNVPKKNISATNSDSCSVAEKCPQNLPQSAQESRYKQSNIPRTKDKSPSRRVYKHGLDKSPGTQNRVVISVKDETVTATKGKPPQPAKKEAVTKVSRTKQVFV